MACIYPSTIINDIRKCVQNETTFVKRDVRFPGDVIKPITVESSPGTQQVGKLVVPIWCSSCGDELPKGLSVIHFWYDAHPGESNSDPGPAWIHIEKCKHVGDGVGK
jgi:hypothetical protein